MSAGQIESNRSLSLGSGRSTSAQAGPKLFTMDISRFFEPCAATANNFLYAQGTSILCLQRDTLAIERRFQRHTEEVLLISTDNLSERGAGRLVVSYDAGQTAIVWDALTGDEIARFVSYEHIRVAAWMRNGNVAFGNSQGNVILFEPSTSEHISARTIFDPITAIAPAADCRTYAIGYMNGSILVAALQPSFTILHTLSTTRAPSPIVTLAWHASSSKQKSDMLATQTLDGDLRVWSIAKSPTSDDTARVVRILTKSDASLEPGPNWLAWSKNGRILQFSDGRTSIWDVRTKHISYEPVSTPDVVTGLAIHGPGAILFTIGPNQSVQQFNLNPPTLVANVHHPPIIPPPSPPVSIEEQKQQASAPSTAPSAAAAVTVPLENAPHEHLNDMPSATAASFQQISSEMERLDEKRQQRSGQGSPASSKSRSRTGSISSQSSGGRRHHPSSISSKGTTRSSNDGTLMSIGSSIHSSRESISTGASSPGTSSRSRPRASRLRQEVLRSPDEPSPMMDLFPYTRARLSDVPHRHAQGYNQDSMTDDDLRLQMLSVVFGWDDDIEGLIQDELSRHAPGSAAVVVLSKWLGDVDPDSMAAMVISDTMTSSDWMLLALSSIGSQQKKLGQAYVRKTLEQGDIHTAASILLGLGDQNDAVEVYVSHKLYMEAVLLACLVFREDWGRQAALVKKWGEYAIEHGQRELAIRCYSCLGSETTQQWSPTGSLAESLGVLSPPLSPPVVTLNASRFNAKNSTLKLITTFGEKQLAENGKALSKFHGLGDDDRTPMNAAGITPIAESAVSPGGMTPSSADAYRRTARSLPASARTITPGGYPRSRLAAIGETPLDSTPRISSRSAFNTIPLPTPVDSGSEKDKKGKSHDRKDSSESDVPLTLSSAKYEPWSTGGAKSPMAQVRKEHLPSPARDAFTILKEESRTRNGSRDRKPDGLQIQWPPMESIITGDYMTSPELSTGRPRHARSNTMSSISSAASSIPSRARGRSAQTPLATPHSAGTQNSPLHTGRSIDQYISSLDEATYHAKKQRATSRRREESRDGRSRGHEDVRSRGRSHSRQRIRERESSETRGRSGLRYIKPAKRSPSSPVPMSPDELQYEANDSFEDERYYGIASPLSEASTQPRKTRSRSNARGPSSGRLDARPSESARREVRKASPDRRPGSRAGSKLGGRSHSRRPSPDGREDRLGVRGRSKVRKEGSLLRSPSSPLPMSPQAKLYKDTEADDQELKKVREERQRFRSRNRSTSRKPTERGTSAMREPSPDRRRHRDRSESRQASERRPRERGTSVRREVSPDLRRIRESSRSRGRSDVPDKVVLRRSKSERTLKKEMAALELEERRKSLARRPSAPAIPHPGELSGGRPPHSGRHHDLDPTDFYRSPAFYEERETERCRTTSPGTAGSGSIWGSGTNTSSVSIGLPATPRAMRHPRYMSMDPNERDGIPAVPNIPENLAELSPPAFKEPPPAFVESPPTQQQEWQAIPPPPPPPPQQEWKAAAPLPSSVYNPSYNPLRRSISAPIPDDPGSPPPLPAELPTHPAFQHTLPPSSRRRNLSPGGTEATRQPTRKVAPGEARPGTLGFNTVPVVNASSQIMVMGNIDETMQSAHPNDNLVPPPPPPPPVLPELAHLAGNTPPPPPFPPSGSFSSQHSQTSSSSGVGVINIGIDGGSVGNSHVVEVPPPPPPINTQHPAMRQQNSHHRHKSINDRMMAAAERLRSVSRTRTKSPFIERTVSPQEHSPYESVPDIPFVHQSINRQMSPPVPQSYMHGIERQTSPPVPQLHRERHPLEVRAQMTKGEIQSGFFEGGMI